jgi:hypothetical protein
VELGTVLHFRNLTELPATVDALNVLEPDHLDLPAGQSRPAKVVGATGKSHPYKVKVGTEWAHGSSDPDLIIP